MISVVINYLVKDLNIIMQTDLVKTLEREADYYRVYNHLDQLVLQTTNPKLAHRVFQNMTYEEPFVQVQPAKTSTKRTLR